MTTITKQDEALARACGGLGNGVATLLAELPVILPDEVRENTPLRVAKAWAEMLGGYTLEPDKVLGRIYRDATYDEIILVRNINFTSICEHHLLPFSGLAHVGYIPTHNEIVGLSKLSRLVDCYARRLQVQERLTQQVAIALKDKLNPAGVAVVVSASHGCMQCRGVRQQDSTTVTSVMLGKFREFASARAEVMSMIGLA